MSTQVTIGDLIEATSVMIAVITFLYAWTKDRVLKKKEYADKVRLATANTVAKLERRKELLLSFFDVIQPIITDADVRFWKEKNVVETRDLFWREVSLAYHLTKEKVLNEQIEIAYVDLYGYDSNVKRYFDQIIALQKKIDEQLIVEVLLTTQEVLLSMEGVTEENLKSAFLGNQLRQIVRGLKVKYGKLIEEINLTFNREVEEIIRASDDQIYTKQVVIKGHDPDAT